MFFSSTEEINSLISKGMSRNAILKNLSLGQFLERSNSDRYWILKLLVAT